MRGPRRPRPSSPWTAPPRRRSCRAMRYQDLREFLSQLERAGELKRVRAEVDPKLEMTEVCDRVLKAGGPALLFEKPKGHAIPVLANLFGTTRRVALAMGAEAGADPREALREIGKLLAFLKEPEPPRGFRDVLERWIPIGRQVMHMAPKEISGAPCQQVVWEGKEIDLSPLPIQTCWPEDAGPLITWGLTVTRGPRKARQNLGIYRQQLIAPDKLTMRWLPHRGGAIDFREHSEARPGEPFPVAVALGADPATILGAVTPVPDTLSEYQFAGLLRGSRTELAKCLGSDLQVPASSEIVLEGVIRPGETAAEGPFGDHTGYYNERENFPVFTVERVTTRRDPIYHSTYTGKPPEGCSYRLAVASMKKQFPGHAKRVMFGIWSTLRQFMYTKFIVVTDDDIDVRNWKEVVWALATRVDAARDVLIVENTPIDYLDFASPVSGLGSKMGIDATNKWPAETSRAWGRPIAMRSEVKRRVDLLWKDLGL